MVSGGMTCVKYLLFVFNLLFVISGIIILTIGAIVLNWKGIFSSFVSDQYYTGPLILIVVGVIIFVVAFFGCCGAVRENHCMVITFAVMLLAIFCLELAAGISGYVLKDDVKKGMEEHFNQTLPKYGNDSEVRSTWDMVQSDLSCCGITGPQDWNIFNNTFVPNTCCRDIDVNAHCSRLDAYSDGCLEKMQDNIERYGVTIGAVGIGIAFVQLVGVIFACCLAKSIRKEYETV